jgi:hypothetical protein
LVGLIDTGHGAERRDALLSDTARTSGGGPLRLFILLMLASALLLGIGLAMSNRLLPLAAELLAKVEGLSPLHKTIDEALLTTPALSGPMSLIPLSPSDLMQLYPPQAAQSLSDGEFDQLAWQRFQRPAATTSLPHISILVTGLGLNRALTSAAILYLPPAVSLSFSPYAPDLSTWIEAARAEGHEALVDLPMESAAPQDDPGIDGLMTGLRPEENNARIDRIIDRAPHALGVTTALGSRFLTDPAALQPVLTALSARGLAIIEASPDPRLLTRDLATQAKLPHIKATFAIDEGEEREAILGSLATLAVEAQHNAQSLVVVAPSPLSLALIAGWCKQLRDQGLALTPASHVLAP